MLSFISDTEGLLDLVHNTFINRIIEALLMNGAPVGLVGLAEDVDDGPVQLRQAAHALQYLFDWLEVLLDRLHYARNRVLEEKYYTIKV